MLTIGVVYMVTVGTRLLPKPQTGAGQADDGDRTLGFVSRPALIHSYGVGSQVCKIRIPHRSEFVGRTLRDLQLRTVFHVNALAVSTPGRQGPVARRCNADTLVQAGDIFFIKSSSKEAIANLVKSEQVELIDPVADLPSVVHLAELIVPPRSELIGSTVREIDFFRTFGAMVLALQHGAQRDVTRTSDTPLQTGDTLLIAANAGALKRLRKSRSNLLLVSEQEEQSDPLLGCDDLDHNVAGHDHRHRGQCDRRPGCCRPDGHHRRISWLHRVSKYQLGKHRDDRVDHAIGSRARKNISD